MVADIAVNCGAYAVDRLYSYRIPSSLDVRPGVRVTVPFGRGNKRTEGIVAAVEDASEDGLKAVETVLDAEPVLDAEQLRLAYFMRERYFCTFYDAVKAILPAGLWFSSTEIFTIPPDAPDWHDLRLRLPEAKQILELIADLGGSAPESVLREQLPDEQVRLAALQYLKGKKLLRSGVELNAKAGKKTEKMARLLASVEDAEAFASRRQKTAPLQAGVLNLLCSVGSGSCHEIAYLTGASMATLRRLEKLGLIGLFEREILHSLVPAPTEPMGEPVLNGEQTAAYEGILAQMRQAKPGAALLYGVTGSGKTAVYIQLIYRALEAGQSAVLLVPEIALTPQLLGRLNAHFGSQVAILHSGLRVSERFDEWRRIRNGQARVVVGTRSAVFAPVQRLGLLILDEEQEHTYKSENAPRYHAREIALYRGLREHALVLLGSATPSVETMYRAKNGDFALFCLKNRYNGKNLPSVEIVDLKKELRAGNATSISSDLEEAIRDRILENRQSILFLNRRGNSRYLVCVECGEAPSCPRCSVHLTYHSANGRLMCHYCGYSQPVPARCPLCGGPLKPVGTGTQKVEEELHAFFPNTAVLRMDADTISAENNHEALLRRFREQKIPILLGTQMVAKGLDFEDVTLVGVVDADMSLYVDNYRAAETTFSLITQVVGRAGRGSASGAAVIQTMTPEHPVLRMAAEQNYDAFYELEIRMRELHGTPPFGDVFTVTFTGLHEEQVMQSAVRFREALRQNLGAPPYDAIQAAILGPAPCAVAKVNYSYRYRLTLQCKNTKPVRGLLSFLLCAFAKDKANRGVNASIDCNSYE